jgi:hypothetical protein
MSRALYNVTKYLADLTSPTVGVYLIQFLGHAGASRMGATRSHSNPGIRRPGSDSLAQ